MKTLVNDLVAAGALKSQKLIDAFLATDRRWFVPARLRHRAYDDVALPLGYEVTISQPSTLAIMLEWLDLRPGQRVLDVGAGSGWSTVLIARSVRPLGQVHGVELVRPLRDAASRRLLRCSIANANIHQAGKELGWPRLRPYDRILVSATASQIPTALLGQLMPGGLMVAPVGYNLVRVRKDRDSKITTEEKPGFIFSPLKNPRTGAWL